jgi:hypothetical protein
MKPDIEIAQSLLELHHRQHLYWSPRSDLSASYPKFHDILASITGIHVRDIHKIAAKVKIKDSINMLDNELPLAKEVIDELEHELNCITCASLKQESSRS